ncbi:MAG: hypothetical protein D6788_03410 [Planctomycetota bacterium]|nr:MAG: hypothetical protein D6788_03410 [Planctomycetota bacterium]
MARAEARGSGDSKDGVGGFHPLRCGGNVPGKQVGGLIQAVAKTIARAHEGGLMHGDVHPGNVLIARSGTSSVPAEAVLTDLQAARWRDRPLGPRASLASLAELDQFFHREATRTQRLRFLRAYLAHRARAGGFDGPVRTLLAIYAEIRQAHASRLVRRRDRRLRRAGKYFARMRFEGGWRVTVALRLERRHLFPESNIPDRDRAQWRTILARVLASADGADGMGTVTVDGVSCEWHRLSGWGERLRATLGHSAHRRRFLECHRARHRDRHVPLILGYGERRRGGLTDVTVLLRPAIAGEPWKGEGEHDDE